jgi:hypothetical protein
MATITATNGAGTTSPLEVLGYETNRESRNIVHDLIDGGIAVALISPRPRSGELRLLYPNEAEAWASLALHAQETSFALIDGDVPAVGMTYVVAPGSVRLTLDPETNAAWTLTVPYQEIEP